MRALARPRRAIDHYEEIVGDTIPDKMPMPLQVHRREGEPCPRCGATIAAIHYSERINLLLPRGADRRQGPRRPPPLAAAQVSASSSIERSSAGAEWVRAPTEM